MAVLRVPQDKALVLAAVLHDLSDEGIMPSYAQLQELGILAGQLELAFQQEEEAPF